MKPRAPVSMVFTADLVPFLPLHPFMGSILPPQHPYPTLQEKNKSANPQNLQMSKMRLVIEAGWRQGKRGTNPT